MPDRPTTVKVTIDGQELEVPPGTLVIRAAEQLGTIVPRFCDHRLLAPLGACRQCLVEVIGQRKPLTACTTTVTDGMEVKTQVTSEVARAGQEGNLELLLINHPLDCPMCDKGGECPLQDFSYSYGPNESRMEFPRRVFDGEGVEAEHLPQPLVAEVGEDRVSTAPHGQAAAGGVPALRSTSASSQRRK